MSHRPSARRWARQDRSRGAAAVETALVLPLVLLIFFGIVEFGFVFKDYIGITSALRQGARYASVGKVGDASFPAGAVQQVSNGVIGVDMSHFNYLYVYDASTSTDPPGTCSSSCLSYSWNAATKSFGSPSGSWDPCSVAGTSGRVGIALSIRHVAFTSIVPLNITLSDHAVFAFEPGSCP